MMRRHFTLSLLFLALSLSVHAQSESTFGISRIAYSTSSAAKGFAGVASSSETAWAALSNAAAVPLSGKTLDTEFIYQQWAPDLSQSNCFGVAGSYRFGKLGFSLAGVTRSGEKITDAMDENGAPLDDFTPKDIILGLGFGYRPLEWLSAGVSLGFQQRKLYEGETLSAFSASVFVMGQYKGLSAALGVSDFGTQTSSGDKYDLPTSVTLGIDYAHAFNEKHSLCADLDFDYYFDGGLTLAIGAEYSFRELLFVRGGYHYGSDDALLPSFATLGLGFRFKGIKISGACLLGSDYLDGTMTLGLGYQF